MASNELRKDYLLNRWVVIAKDRKKRPTDFTKKEVTKPEGVCPFCPDNEHMTPPAVLVYLSTDSEFRKEQDRHDFCHKNWLVRVIPNLFPAFSPPTRQKQQTTGGQFLLNAVGHHEVVIESPCHSEQLSVAPVSQIVHVINAYLDRLETLSKKQYVKHVAIFRNHGQEAGASLSHPHTQLIASPVVPALIKEELDASKNYWNIHHECVFCDVLNREAEGPRFIYENKNFVVFTPYASVNPLEFWVLPKQHNSNMLTISKSEVTDLAKTMRICLGALRSLLNDPPYNFGFHTVLTEDAKGYYHWHLEIYPKLLTWAGFEKSTCMFINSVSPEDAATELRSAVKAELKTLK